MDVRNKEIKRIFIVALLLLILLIGVFLIRYKRNMDLKKIADMHMQNGQVQEQTQKTPIDSKDLPGRYYIEAERTSLSVNEIFNIDVMFEADGRSVSGSDVYLSFDPTLLQADQDILLGDFFLNFYRVETDNENGYIKVTGFRSSEKEELTSPVNMMRISFLAKKAGSARIGFDFEQGGTNKTTIVEKGTGKNLLGQTNDIIITIN